ncbi:putative HNH endonuclease [Staphylococcus phage SA5]|uniref:Putative HNH endonuclease n=1 Tax=Staphylococcus phage SA5 TaxID=1239385 RepID=K7R285_9CAUD|nr:putative HNH endonuclease [Staphylococcus phage SA5]AFV80851.1 putative HNH endonuclease [Staphylococcus phage SA5]
MIGETINKLKVIKESSKRDKSRCKMYECLCECGEVIIVRSSTLRQGKIKSCGCESNKIHSELMRERNTTHGLSSNPMYQRWLGMKQRCYDVNAINYKNYGGRGIEICEEWKNDFKKFYDYMGDPPNENYQIDRINNDGNYEPGNVKWSTRSENSTNIRKKSTHNIYKKSNNVYNIQIVRKIKLNILVQNL